MGDRDGGTRRGAVGDLKTAPGALLRRALFAKMALPVTRGRATRVGVVELPVVLAEAVETGWTCSRICRGSDDGIDAESSVSKQGPPQAATAPRMTPLQDSRLAVPGPEIDVSAREHGSRAAGPLKSHSACRRQGAAV